MKKIKWIVAFLSLFLLVELGIVNQAQADAGNFGLKANYNDHQVAKNEIIDVFGEPGSKQTISIGLYNKDDKPHSYVVDIYTAYTNNSGGFAFNSNSAKDPSLKIKLRDYIAPKKQTIRVNPGEMKNVSVGLTIPTKQFQGFLMGGFSVRPSGNEKLRKQLTSNGTILKSKFIEGIPIRVSQSRNMTMAPQFKVRYVTPYGNPTMKARGVNANLQNYVKGYNASIDVKATVTRRPDDHKFKKVAKQTRISPAPNSNYDYQISWGKTPLQAGDYHLHMKLTTSDKTKSWIVDKDFSISNEDAAKYNKLSGIKPNYMWLWILIAILVLLLVLGLGVYFGRRNQQKNQPPMNNYNQR